MSKPTTFKIDGLHPEILRSYRGTLVRTCPDGSVELHFPSAGHATAWAATCEVEDRVSIPGFMAGSFADPIFVVLAPAAVSA